MKVIPSGNTALDMYVESRGKPFGHITSIALNADGTRLFFWVPVSQMFGERAWVNNQHSDPGMIMVVNVNGGNRPEGGDPNTNEWRTVVDKIPAGIEVFDIQATNKADTMMFVARGDSNHGVKIIKAIEGALPAHRYHDFHPDHGCGNRRHLPAVLDRRGGAGHEQDKHHRHELLCARTKAASQYPQRFGHRDHARWRVHVRCRLGPANPLLVRKQGLAGAHSIRAGCIAPASAKIWIRSTRSVPRS